MPEDDLSSPSSKETPAKGSGGKDKTSAAGAAANKTVPPAPGKMIVEAALDWEKMEVQSVFLFGVSGPETRNSLELVFSSIAFAQSHFYECQ